MKKRIHIKKAPYLLTTNTRNRVEYFQEDVFCNILMDVIEENELIKSYNLIGAKINPEHVHLILQPTGEANISQIMQSIKRVSAIRINQIIFAELPDIPYGRYEWSTALKHYRSCFKRKYNHKVHNPFCMFRWHNSFDDQLIRTPEGLKRSMIYLERQSVKHQLAENKFLYLNPDLPADLNFIGKPHSS